jgi:hypothetical protein
MAIPGDRENITSPMVFGRWRNVPGDCRWS